MGHHKMQMTWTFSMIVLFVLLACVVVSYRHPRHPHHHDQKTFVLLSRLVLLVIGVILVWISLWNVLEEYFLPEILWHQLFPNSHNAAALVHGGVLLAIGVTALYFGGGLRAFWTDLV